MPELTPTENLAHLFHRALSLIRRGHHHKGSGHPGQSHILAIIDARDTISQRELMERLQIRSASLSELLIKLERNGDIVREKDEQDKRNIILTLTDQGRAVVSQNAQARRDNAATRFAPLDEAEQAQLAALLTKLVESWQTESDETSLESHGHCHKHDHGHEHCHGHGHGHGRCCGHGRHGHGHDGHHHRGHHHHGRHHDDDQSQPDDTAKE